MEPRSAGTRVHLFNHVALVPPQKLEGSETRGKELCEKAKATYGPEKIVYASDKANTEVNARDA